jgi:aryl-alcohol dehydrogenase-like predicted oxidoreductase
LGTDCIDLYQLHGGTIEDPIDDIIATLEDLKRAGKIRSYGISSIRPNVIREWVRRSKLSSVMMQYSLLDRRPEEECLWDLHQHGVGVLARGSLAQGLLLGKPAKQQPGRTVQDVERLQQSFSAIIGDNQPMAMALGFVLANPAISSAVVGLRTEKQLTTLLDSLQDPMPDEDMISGLNAIAPATRYDQHR